MHAEMWEPVNGIGGPCDQVSFSYIPNHTATVVMTFNGVAGGASRDLTLNFKRVVVLCAEEECPGGFAPLPKALPQLESRDRPTCTFPLLRLLGSEPLKQYDLVFHRKDEPMAHFCLISFHNLVQVIASVDVEATWSASGGQ